MLAAAAAMTRFTGAPAPIRSSVGRGIPVSSADLARKTSLAGQETIGSRAAPAILPLRLAGSGSTHCSQRARAQQRPLFMAVTGRITFKEEVVAIFFTPVMAVPLAAQLPFLHLRLIRLQPRRYTAVWVWTFSKAGRGLTSFTVATEQESRI